MSDTPNSLDRLEEMRASGRIDAEEYEALREAILGGDETEKETAEETDDTASRDTAQGETPAPRRVERLQRRADKKMIGGVCGGLADRFDIPVGVIRVAFVLVTIFSGPFSPLLPVIVYGVLWGILPAGKSVALPASAAPPPPSSAEIEGAATAAGPTPDSKSALSSTALILICLTIVCAICFALGGGMMWLSYAPAAFLWRSPDA